MQNAGPFTQALKARLSHDLSARLDVIISRSAEDAQTLEEVFAFLDANSSTTTGSKRSRGEDEMEGSSSKRPRNDNSTAADDHARYTLHALSVTAPVRKKVDITIRVHSIQLSTPGSGTTGVSPEAKVEASIPVASISRAFILPTHNKTKPHWTVILLPSDTPAPKGKDNVPESQQLIFGLDALAGADFRTSEYDALGVYTSTRSLDKGMPTLDSLRAFLSHLPEHARPHLEPDMTALRGPNHTSSSTGTKSRGGAASSSTKPTAGTVEGQDGAQSGVDAYRGAKAGTLWFFAEGLLWGESKPCEFWALKDILDVVVQSPTGRTCSVYVRRRAEPQTDENSKEGEDEADQDARAVVTELGMIDGKEQDSINGWVRRYQHLFGKSEATSNSTSVEVSNASAPTPAPAAAIGKVTANTGVWADDEEDDEDFVGSESSSNESDDNDDSGSNTDGSDEEDEAEAHTGDDDNEATGEAKAELDPAHHPLLRLGAMPKRVSGAVIDMVVDMVQEQVTGAEVDELEEDELDE